MTTIRLSLRHVAKSFHEKSAYRNLAIDREPIRRADNVEEWTESVVPARYRFARFGIKPLLLCLVWHTRDGLIRTSMTIRHA